MSTNTNSAVEGMEYRVFGSRWVKEDFWVKVVAKNKVAAIRRAKKEARALHPACEFEAEIDSTTPVRLMTKIEVSEL